MKRYIHAVLSVVLVASAAFGCSESPKAERLSGEYRLFYRCGGTGSVCVYPTPVSSEAKLVSPTTACFPGPKVVAE